MMVIMFVQSTDHVQKCTRVTVIKVYIPHQPHQHDSEVLRSDHSFHEYVMEVYFLDQPY